MCCDIAYGWVIKSSINIKLVGRPRPKSNKTKNKTKKKTLETKNV
jgi:hypothetical protein